MQIDWNRYRARTHRGNRSRWLAGHTREHSWSRIVNDHDVWLVVEGEGRVLTRSGWVDLRPGRCLWFTPGFYYDAEQNPDKPAGMYFVHFDLVDAEGNVRDVNAPRPPEVIDPLNDALLRPLFEQLVRLITSTHGPTRLSPDRQMRADALLTALLTELDAAPTEEFEPQLAGTRKHHHDAVIRVMQRILHDPADVPPVAELAESAGYSAEHFSRVFREVAGYSPQQYIVHVRTVHACELLAHTSLSIAEIAEKLGYSSLYFFSRQFRKQTGVSPTEGRRSLASGGKDASGKARLHLPGRAASQPVPRGPNGLI